MALSLARSAGPPPEVQLDAVKEQEQKPEPRQEQKQKEKPAAAPAPAPPPAPAPVPAPRPAAAPPSDRPFQLAVEPPPAEGGRWRVRLTGAGMEETASQPAAAARRTRYGCQLAVQPEDGRWRVRITTNDAAEQPKQTATAERMEKLMAGIQDAQARIQALQGQAPARAEPPANPRVTSLANEDEMMMSGSPRGPTGARNLFAPTGVAGEKVKITVKQPQRESKPQKQQSQPKPKKQKEPKAAPVETSPPGVGYSQECSFKALQLPVGEEGWDGPRAALSAAVPSSSVSSWAAAKAVAVGGKREAAAGANEYVGWETQGEDAAAKTKKARADAQARAEKAATAASAAAVAAAKGSSQKIASPEVGEWVKTAKAEAEAALVGDAAFAASPKMLAPSPLRDGPAAFDAPAPVSNDYAAAATGELRQPSLFADDAEAAELAKEIAEEQVAGWVQKQQAAEMALQAKQIAAVQVASWIEKQDASASGADAAFAAAPKMLAPSPLRDGPAAFDAPAPVRNDYAAAATGELRQPSLFEDSPASKAKSEKARNAEHDTPRTAQKRAEVLANVLKAQAKTTPPKGAQR